MEYDGMEWSGTEWNRDSIPLFGYFMKKVDGTKQIMTFLFHFAPI